MPAVSASRTRVVSDTRGTYARGGEREGGTAINRKNEPDLSMGTAWRNHGRTKEREAHTRLALLSFVAPTDYRFDELPGFSGLFGLFGLFVVLGLRVGALPKPPLD